ncbi:MAG: hypothetical protein LBF16_03540 [Pseudomonadales bacterium]|jgi:hypothetical protein|nr:hypothetical protein [Pseudomonadales bacterium]
MKKRMKSLCIALAVLAVPPVFSQERQDIPLDSTPIVEVTAPPESIADSFLEFTPSRATLIVSQEDQLLEGKVDLIWGANPHTIIIPAHIMIRALEVGVTVEMYVKKFPDRDAYYPIYMTTRAR